LFIKKELLVLLLLMIALVGIGFILPAVLTERRTDEAAFATPVPTITPRPPLISAVKTSTPTPLPDEIQNCTYHKYYWEERILDWPAEVVMGERAYSREEMRDLFKYQPSDLHGWLLTQMYTAFLNILYGANIASVQQVLIEADSWLASNPPGSELSEFNRIRGRELASLVEAYNLGVYGPGACPNVPPTPTQTPTRTPTAPESTADVFSPAIFLVEEGGEETPGVESDGETTTPTATHTPSPA
jgi:hypothetical protein